MKKITDLTEGPIFKQLTIFAIPIFAGQLFQTLYNSADAIIVGRLVGKTALAAVTGCGDIAMLLAGFFTGLSTGSSVLFSRFYGAKKYEQLHASINTAIVFSVILGVIMAALGIIFAPLLLTIFACPADVQADALIYLRVYLIGTLFTSLYNIGAGVLRAVGNSRDPFMYLIISSITNLLLDLLFVIVFHIGILGVALATIISQFLSASLVFVNMLRTQDVYHLELSRLRIDRKLLWEVIRLGLPAGIQASITSISNIFVLRYVNMMGSGVMAGYGAAKKLDRFLDIIAVSIGLALTTFISQNLGAGRKGRAFRSIWVGLLIGSVTVGGASILLYFNRVFFLSFFTQDAQAIAAGNTMLAVLAPWFILALFMQISSHATRGYGYSNAAMLLSLLGVVGVRQLYLQIAMRLDFDVVNVYRSFPLGWFSSALFVSIFFCIKVARPYLRQKRAEQCLHQ